MSVLVNFSPAAIPVNLVREVYIETGLDRGESMANAVRAGFQALHGIEIVAGHCDRCRKRFADCSKVHIHQGSSPDVLPGILRDRPTTFWLDAHYQGGPREEMDPSYGECPLLAELETIRAYPWTVAPVILIDDAHLFHAAWGRDYLPGMFRREEWPTIAEIADRLPDYHLVELDDVIYCWAEGAAQCG